MTKGNVPCPCGSGKKFKRCCRNQERPPEQCFFCKQMESPDRKGTIQGQYVKIVDKDKSTEEDAWACDACIRKQQGTSDPSAALLMMMATMPWLNGSRVNKRKRG